MQGAPAEQWNRGGPTAPGTQVLLWRPIRLHEGLLLEAVQHARQRPVVLDGVEPRMGELENVRCERGLRARRHGRLWPGWLRGLRVQLLESPKRARMIVQVAIVQL